MVCAKDCGEKEELKAGKDGGVLGGSKNMGQDEAREVESAKVEDLVG